MKRIPTGVFESAVLLLLFVTTIGGFWSGLSIAWAVAEPACRSTTVETVRQFGCQSGGSEGYLNSDQFFINWALGGALAGLAGGLLLAWLVSKRLKGRRLAVMVVMFLAVAGGFGALATLLGRS